jgi:hypothetical protein
MAKYIGRAVNVGIAQETTRGIGRAPQFWVPKTDYDLWDKTNKATSEESFSHIHGFGGQEIVTSRYAEGSLGGEVNAKSFPLLLWGTLGTLTSASEGAGYKHTLALSNSNQHKSLAITTKEGNGDRMFKNVMVDSLEMSVTPNEIVTFNAGLKSKFSADSSATSSYSTADYKFVGRDLTFKVADDTASLAAATKLSTKELTLTISKNAEYDYVNSTLEAEDIHNKNFTIEGSLTLNYEDNTWLGYMANGTYKAIGISLETTRHDLGGGLYPKFYIEFPRVAFSEWERQTENDDIVEQSLNFKVLYNQASGNVISDCYVINDEPSYT